ncbi:MAG: cation:proton antiporter [Chthoniobacteraceae bacterium]
MDGINFLQDLAIVTMVAGVTGWLCLRIGLSSVVGFLLAGILIGPHTPPFSLVSNDAQIQTLSQLGLVFLMFSVGMGLSLRRLRRMGMGVLIATAIGALLVFGMTRSVGLLIGWTPTQTLFLAAILMVSSSAIIDKVLHEIGATHEPSSRMAMAVTVLEDVVSVVMITLLTSVVHVAGAEASTPIWQTLGLILVFVILLVVAGLLLVPRVLALLSRTADVDLQTVLIAALVLSFSMLAVKAGYSLALGAFLLGAIVAETSQRAQVERYLQGVRDIFTAVFFVSIGMLMDVQLIVENWLFVLLFGVFTVFCRVLATSIGLMVIGNSTKDAVRSGLMLTPIGEFSFIIAQLGVATKAAPDVLYPLAVGLALFTAFTAPIMIKYSAAISRVVERLEPRWLNNLVKFYHNGLDQIQQRQQGNVVWQRSQKHLTQIGIGFLFVTGLLAFSQQIYTATFARLGTDLPFAMGWKTAFWSVLAVIALVPLVAIWRNLLALSAIFTEALAPDDQQQSSLRVLTQAGLQTIFAVLIAIWLWLLLPFDLAAIWTVGAVVFMLGLLLLALRRMFVQLHSIVEVELGEMLSTEETERVPRQQEELLQRYQDWNIHLHEVSLPEGAEVAGKTLSELSLRQRFGCSVAGVERHGYPIPNPSPDLVLYPGDTLLVLATPERISEVRAFVQKTAPVDDRTFLLEEIEIEGVSVPETSGAAGKMLVELEIPASTGVQLVGIERDGQRLLNPGPFQGIEVGDRLLALGTHQQIAAFQRWLRQAPSEPAVET